ncbi:right-handed parallel beta-helix repeat-containing protein [Deferrisoma palaeochoriense]
MPLLFLAGCRAPGPGVAPSDLHAMPTESITGRAEWSGEVVVDRIVVVRSGGELVLAPGTRVRFRRIDWDGDGIGDAEITVEGRLTAVGTADRPIDLASAEPDPRPGDWKYLMVNFAAGAKLDRVRARHAFSGIQVHYSPAAIRNCEFAENVDGVRFSTADLVVTGTWIHHNTHGIRFEERGHPARIEGNEISDNEVGVFAVTRCGGGTVFRRNNLRRNRVPVKLGWEQDRGLAFPENYWGGLTAQEVAEASLDGRERPRGPGITVEPVLPDPEPVPWPFRGEPPR